MLRYLGNDLLAFRVSEYSAIQHTRVGIIERIVTGASDLATNSRTPKLLLLAFVLVAITSGLNPTNRADWALENVLVLAAIPLLLRAYSLRWLSNLSFGLIFVFLTIHEIGAHYTYSQVPYDQWWQSLTGHTISASFGWGRNHFDRFVHLIFGALLFLPVREFLLQTNRISQEWIYPVGVALLVTASTLYELIEWGASTVFGGDLGMAYIGTQGDVWDTHKDLALALTGALTAALSTAAICRENDAHY